MRFRRRMAAAILAVVMIATSVQGPGGVAYAAELESGSMKNGQEALEPTAEANLEGGGESADEKDAVLDSEERQEHGAASSENKAQPDEGAAADSDNQTGKETETADTAEKIKTEETVTEGEKTVETDETVTDETETPETETAETETEEAEAEEAATEETETEEATAEETATEETVTKDPVAEVEEEEKVVEAEPDGVYQLGGAPSDSDGITAFAESDAAAYLYQQMRKRTKSISMNGYKVAVEDMGDLVTAVVNEHPDLYFYEKCNITSSGSNITITVTYGTGYDDDAFRTKTDDALSCVSDGMSDFEKAAALHDYLAVNVEYDYKNYLAGSIPKASFNAYGTLVNGTAVCQGYMLAYKYLLSKVGIENYMVTSDTMNHGWNLVKLDGKYYHVDVTWDDPSWDMAGRVYHTNMFRSDANFGDHKDWTVTSGSSTVDYKATDTTYESAFWVDSTAPLVFDGNDCYYIAYIPANGKLMKASFLNPADSGTEIVEIGKWVGATGIFQGAFSGLYEIGGRLFYNDATSIYSIEKDGTDKQTVFTPAKEKDESIFYSAYRGGKVVYGLHDIYDGPNLKVKQEVRTADIDNLPVTYRIRYELDGGVNDSGNPGSYNRGTEAIALKDAAKEGFKFGGWYEDAGFTKRVENISEGSEGDITLYAKWIVEDAIDCENLDYTFTTLDDGKVSSKADGKPKILVFFKPDCWNCQQVNKELSAAIKAFAGTDIYAVEINKSTKDDVSKFKDEYGCDEITYCYDETTTANQLAMYKYYHAAGNSGYSVVTPVIAYIDAEDRLQKVTTGYTGWSAIVKTLQDYCGYDYYSINYELSGGTNNSENPESYRSREGAVLKDPVKGGYTFEGWYTDAAFEEKVTEISKGTKGNVTLYAKWEKSGEETDPSNLDYTFTTLDDEKVSSKADGKPKILFFFKTGCMNCQLLSANLRNNIHAFVGADIYAVEINQSTKSTVSQFKKDNGCDEITFCYDTTGKVNNPAMWNYLKEAGNSSASVATPVIAYIDAKNRLQKVTTGPVSWSAVLQTLQESCGYDYYTISYMLRGGTNNSENPKIYRSSEGAVLKDPVKDGDTFAGWYTDAVFTEKVTGIPKGTTGNITLCAKWEVERELGLDNLDYTFEGIDRKKFSSKAEGKPKLLIFFREDSDSCKNTIQNISKDISRYDEVDVCAIDMTQAEDCDDMIPILQKFKDDYGCNEIKFAYDNWIRPLNYDKAYAYEELAGWRGMFTPLLCFIDKDNKLQWISEGEQTSDAVLGNLQKYCGYQPPEAYRITYELDGGTNHKNNPASYTSKSATIVLKDPEKQGYAFGGWYKDAEFKEKITEIPQGSTGDITLYAKWREGLGLTNPKQVYVGLDSKQLSSTADGKPKLLVFFEGTGEESRNTIKNITAMIDSLDGVDIYAIESGNASYTDVKAFKDTYGCSGITFAYQNRYDYTPNAEKALAYVKAAGLSESMNYPIICYIDKDNILQWVTEKEQTGDAVLENLKKYCEFGSQGGLNVEITIIFVDSTFVYNGKEQKPKVKVTAAGPSGNDITLKENTDYTLAYKNNKNAGTAKVIVTGMGEYKGTVEETFTIEPAPLIIRAADLVILVGDKIPERYTYEVDGLQGLDELIKEPELSCNIVNTAKEGEYTVTPSGADAGSNYVITYEDGKLVVTTEFILWKVTFDTQGHGKAPAALSGVRSGNTIDSPVEPKADGYRFDGWYRDSECKKAWNFETDIVETDITLYAKWLCVSSDGSFALQEVPDQYYTGKALKPAVTVYDGDTLLKAGRDYQVKYYNNINANVKRKTGNGEGADFNQELPYVEITGKGNYKSTVKVNFNILKVSIGDSGLNPVAGAVLKVNDHLAKANKALKPSVSLKIGKALKKDTDFKLELFTFDASGYLRVLAGAEIPAGVTGEFILLIEGIGNYDGGIMKYIYVADKDHLMKNAKITLGKNLKNVDYTGQSIRLTPANKDGDDVFTVRIGKKILTPGTDYRVYSSDGSVGKSELVVVGTGDYVGRQTTTFNVKGKAFSNSTVSISGITDRTYTGKAHTQNKEAVVTYQGAPLVYGTDYTISYSKNINKGTATMNFIGNPKAGYSGKVKKTFKIAAVDINTVEKDPSVSSITVSYAKAGAKPVDEIILTNKAGVRLRGGKDYTLKYKDNKAVTTAATVTVTGKGNYTGKFDVRFRIVQADLSEDHIVVKPAAVVYNAGKADEFAYTPAIKLMDGKAALKADKDYEIEYLKNTQADYKSYLTKLENGSVKDEDVPRARITAKAGSNYGLPNDIKAIEVPLQIYQTKFKKTDLDVRIGEAVYTGGQVTPDVTVSYKGKLLREGVDYMLTYGANDKAGKNKGSVTVNGLAPYYGGSVTYKFEIIGKNLNF